MAEFAELTARVTEACKTRLGELASSIALPSGKKLEGKRVIVRRNREFVGGNGQISDYRTSVKIAKVDLGAEAIKGARITLAASAEVLLCDAVVGDDGEFVEVAAR